MSGAEFPNVTEVAGRILIGGRIESAGFESRPVVSQCDGRHLGHTPDVDPAVFMTAVDAAERAWAKGLGAWPTARTEDRVAAVASFRDRMLRVREPICRLLMWEIGKSWALAQAEFDRTIEYIDATLEEVKRLDRDSSRFQFAGGIMAQVRRSPLGVTLCMGPFNYPLNETFTTLIPALVMGNVTIVKIPRFGELFWDYLLEPFRDAFPPGVVNIVNGSGRRVVGPAVRSGKIDVLAFIGSSPVASQIKLEHPRPHRFRSILGLDAKNPAIILPDADLQEAVTECVKGSLSFNGQRCTALKILFVHRSVAAAFTRLFVERVEALPYGRPWEPGVEITPLPDPSKPAALRALVDDAVAQGATLLNPHPAIQGTLFRPEVVTNLPLTCRLALEEQFGPVVPVHVFDDLGTVESFLVESPFGAQASIFGKDPAVVGPLIDRLANQVCRINLNTQCQRGPDVFPFTGRKDSAEGTLSVYDALRSFSIRTMVAAKQDKAGKATLRGVLDGDTSRFLTTDFML